MTEGNDPISVEMPLDLPQILNRHGVDPQNSALLEDLRKREDMLCDLMRLAAMQFGMYPQIVSKVLMDIGIGTPIPEAQQAFINGQFAQLMTELERIQREQGNQG